MNVGFIGLGHMGVEMARNLLKAGQSVTVYNRTRGKVDALASAGARVAENVGEACHNDVVITMLADDDAVAGVAFGEGKAIAELPGNAIHVSMSTISVALSDHLAEAHRGTGQIFIAAPGLRQAGSRGRRQALHRRGGRLQGDRAVSTPV